LFIYFWLPLVVWIGLVSFSASATASPHRDGLSNPN